MRKRIVPLLLRIAGPLLAVVVSLVVGGIFIVAIGKDPILVYTRFFSESLGTTYGIGQVLFKATPLMFTGLSAAIAFRAGLFNIGAEGQMAVGALLTAVVPCLFPSLPGVIIIPLALIAGIAGGAFWGSIPGLLKARFGAHEVINTIMMNFIAAGIVSYLVLNVFAVPATVHTPSIPPAAEIPRLGEALGLFPGSPVNFTILLAIASCAAASWFLLRTRLGYEIRTLGISQSAAEYGGIKTGNRMVTAMAIAGGFAGLAGSNFVLGYKHYFELGFSDGTGFIGIAVALLAQNNPSGIIVTSLLFSVLEYGSLTINTIVPKELSNILQAIVIIFMIVIMKLLARKISRWVASTEVERHV
jgi:general nucleoside transport system permease protein